MTKTTNADWSKSLACCRKLEPRSRQLRYKASTLTYMPVRSRFTVHCQEGRTVSDNTSRHFSTQFWHRANFASTKHSFCHSQKLIHLRRWTAGWCMCRPWQLLRDRLLRDRSVGSAGTGSGKRRQPANESSGFSGTRNAAGLSCLTSAVGNTASAVQDCELCSGTFAPNTLKGAVGIPRRFLRSINSLTTARTVSSGEGKLSWCITSLPRTCRTGRRHRTPAVRSVLQTC